MRISLLLIGILLVTGPTLTQTEDDLNAAIRENDRPKITKILKQNKKLKGTEAYSPLAGALFMAELKTVEHLLKKGVDPNLHTRGSSGRLSSPLISLMMRRSQKVEAAKLSDRYGADWNKANVDSMVVLFDNQSDHIALMKFLAKKISKAEKRRPKTWP